MFAAATLKTIEQHVGAIRLCLVNGLPGPTMILVFVGIDAFGALGRPIGQKRASRADFLAWAERYVIKPKGLPMTALELYAARCAALHTLGAESDLSTVGKVRPIFYAWGNRDAEPANAVIATVSKERPDLAAVVVKVEDVVSAFIDGLASFGRDIEANSELHDAVVTRAQKMFGQFSHFPGTPGFEELTSELP